jgi:D-glycero-alpha-D-manno-heptose-7-phosphate kinase
MIISRTPFRISFFGGGTDYPVWYRQHGGAVLATTIDKYCYISCRYLPPFFEHRTRVAYSQIEIVKSNEDIQHPAVRGTLQYMKIDEGIEIHHDGDLPARTGMGSSSSFTVGLLHALYALKRAMPTKTQLMREAIHIEQQILQESVGCQDQVIAAHGGLCRINFLSNDDIHVTPIILPQQRLTDLQSHLLLYFTGFSRTASRIAKEQIDRTPDRARELSTMFHMVEEGVSILTGNEDLTTFGALLHEGWMLKRRLTSMISTPLIDNIYEVARGAGAIGGKLLGAGGGGFVLLFAKPEAHPHIKEALRGLLHVPCSFETMGSQIILYQPSALIARDYPTEFRLVDNSRERWLSETHLQ